MIHVKWDRETLHFPVPPPETKLGKLRADLAEYTHLPLGSFKLIHAGAVMKDDSAPLTAYKIRENSTIALIGGHSLPSAPTPAPSSRPQPKVKEPPTEQSTITAIRTELDRLRTTLIPDVDALVNALAPSAATTLSSPTSAPTPASGSAPTHSSPSHPTPASGSSKPTSSDHTRLSELLLQSLLRLDAMHLAGSDWPEARAERKAAVREVQGVLDRLDGAWSAR
ncbi:hypothetical protein BD769DRAFT_1369242 [Suillus cothurnatus]|nr:hypothetical protein BD769DRAFT_1369242 [Suillus cothurnatus]